MNLDYLPVANCEGHMIPNEETIDLWTTLKSNTNYKSILEIGLNAGHSAAIQLELFPDIKLYSLDIGRHDWTLEAVLVLSERFPDRFISTICHSTAYAERVKSGEYEQPDVDAMFIDGGHTENSVRSDIDFAKWLGVKDVFIDDSDSTIVSMVLREKVDNKEIYIVEKYVYPCHSSDNSYEERQFQNEVSHIRFN